MAKKKEGSDAVRALIVENPTWSDTAIHGALKGEGIEVTVDEVTTARADMGARETWEKKK